MLEPPLPPDPRVQHWLSRHSGPLSLALHMVGIPATFLGALFVPIYLGLPSMRVFQLALALFVGGFLVQFAGHWLEGTDPGEVIFFKRKLGLPYNEFPRRHARREAMAMASTETETETETETKAKTGADADAEPATAGTNPRFGAPAASV